MAGNTGSTTVTSADGLVRVTVGASGELRDLRFAPGTFDGATPAGLARAVLDLVAEAASHHRTRDHHAPARHEPPAHPETPARPETPVRHENPARHEPPAPHTAADDTAPEQAAAPPVPPRPTPRRAPRRSR